MKNKSTNSNICQETFKNENFVSGLCNIPNYLRISPLCFFFLEIITVHMSIWELELSVITGQEITERKLKPMLKSFRFLQFF